MAVKNSEIVAFFEDLATKHLKILHDASAHKHFYRMELDEFAKGTSNMTGNNMILEVIPFKYDGSNRDNSFKVRDVAFLITKSLPTINKIAVSDAFDECEAIVDDVLSMLQRARCGFNKTLITYDPETIECLQISDGKNFGIRCFVSVKSSHNFDVITANWLEDDSN